MGTSAEFASFEEDERYAVIDTVVQAAAGRAPVVANVSAPATRAAIRHARRAETAGADAIAATPPYYYPHSQEELLAHYRAIRSAVDLPLLLYNIPQTVRVRIELSTAQTLASEGTVAGIKDSQNDLEWFRQLTAFVGEGQIRFAKFLGTRHLIDAGILAGADGAIPNLANAFPELCVAVYQAAAAGDFVAAAHRQQQILQLERLASSLTSRSRNASTLGFLKAVLASRGVIASATLTLPLVSPSEEEQLLLVERVETLQLVPA
jgi:4-hydroxy-tetrahydrodipicolinate synthase